MSNRFKVQLSSAVNPRDFVVFTVSPDISENRNVNYRTLNPIHLPGNIYVYGNTTSRSFSITAKLISRTIKEATQNALDLQLLRSWTMPYFGQSTDGISRELSDFRERQRRKQQVRNPERQRREEINRGQFNQGRSLLGAPPDVLFLTAYSNPDVDRKNNLVANLNKIPVVLTQLGNTYSSEVDYIPIATGEPFPIFMSVELILSETHSPNEFNRFKLSDFKAGRLTGF